MKKILLSVVIATTLVLTSCQFDDSALWSKLDEYGESIRDHEQRISALEELCKQMNTNIEALQTLVDALEKRDYVTNVAPIREDGKVVGYTISFAYSDTITIYNGKDGADGVDGKDGYTPQIGVMKDTDNIYYWTLDGEWLLDAKGNKIQANGVNGTDGTNGSNGTNGTNGVTPQLKIENDYWYVSYDNGATWVQLGNASSGSGSSNCVITKVEESETEVVFTLADGSTITLPKGEKAEVVSENNKIYYTTTDGKRMFPTYTEPSYFGAMLVSNTYEDGQGVLTFDDEVTIIRASAFEDFCSDGNCNRLATITIPKSVTIIEEKAFCSCCSLTAFYGKFASTDNLCLIVDGVLISFANGCGATQYIIPDSITNIGKWAFSECTSLTSITIGNSVAEISHGAFSGCTSLTSVTIPDSVISMGDGVFYECTGELIIKSKVIESSVDPYSLGGDWISGAKFTKLTIGDNITKIGDEALRHCDSIISITIPNSVIEIGRNAFSCTAQTEIYCKAITPPTGDRMMFGYNASGCKIYVPTASVEAYKTADGWSNYAYSIVGYDF